MDAYCDKRKSGTQTGHLSSCAVVAAMSVTRQSPICVLLSVRAVLLALFCSPCTNKHDIAPFCSGRGFVVRVLVLARFLCLARSSGTLTQHIS